MVRSVWGVRAQAPLLAGTVGIYSPTATSTSMHMPMNCMHRRGEGARLRSD